MEFTTENIIKIIKDNTFLFLNEQTRKKTIDELNIKFFSDNICKFVDISTDNQNYMSIVIEYKYIHYNILAYKLDVLQKVERTRKLKNLCGK